MSRILVWPTSRHLSVTLAVWATVAGALVVLLLAMHAQNFLALTRPVGQGILVVEAWIPESSLKASLKSYDAGSYRYLALVGAPIDRSRDETTAERAAGVLRKLGFDNSRLVVINMPFHATERTLATAQAFKQWLETSAMSTRSVDVFTVGVHARKSWVLFRAVLGDKYQVGVIAGPEFEYDGDRWMLSRIGLWLVTRNLFGYVYSKLWVILN